VPRARLPPPSRWPRTMPKRSNKSAKKLRVEFKKNREAKQRVRDLTGKYKRGEDADPEIADEAASERISGKGSISRRRTVLGEQVLGNDGEAVIHLDVAESECLQGRVLRAGGLHSDVEAIRPANDHPTDVVRQVAVGALIRCATRRVLKTLATDERHVVATGDRVLFRPAEGGEGIIERVEPRHGVLSRSSRGRRHIIVTNVDQMVIVGSAAEPYLKPALIDRFLVTAEKAEIRPILCINKIDLAPAADLQPLLGVYGQMGYDVLLLSAKTGRGVTRLRSYLEGKASVVTGQSGVGKSSLLNVLEPGLDLKVKTVSGESQKGRHTTTAAELIPLSFGGYVVDTPGIRQFQLWDVIAEEVAGFFRDLRPYVSHCRYPDCTHSHEDDCAVKDAVADGRLDARRYESYLHIHAGDEP